MNRLLFVLFSISVFSCNNEPLKTKLYEEKLKKNLEDNVFKLNSTLNIIELKVLSIESAPLDTVYKEICYARLNVLFKFMRETNGNVALIKKDKQYNEFLHRKLVGDTTIRGYYVTYYVKGTLIAQNLSQSNILYEKVVAYFDNNDNVLYNKLYFKNKGDSELDIEEIKKNENTEKPQTNLLSEQSDLRKFVFAKVKVNVVQLLIGTRKPLNPNDPLSPMGQDEKNEYEYFILTNIKEISNYDSDKKYKFKDAVRKAAMGEKSGIALLYSFDIKDIQIFEFNDYTNASENRERFENMKEITIYENF